MKFLLFSAAATILASGAPLLFVEAHARASHNPRDTEFDRRYRRLWLVTSVAWAAFAIWFWLDSQAIAAFRRPFIVTAAAGMAFIVLFFGFAADLIWPAPPDSLEPHSTETEANQTLIHEQPTERQSQMTLLIAHVFVAISLALALAVFLISSNSAGHRAKGMATIIVGAVFYLLFLLARQSLLTAIGYFCVFEVSAVLTLTLDWNLSSHQWIGVGAQLIAGVVGIIGCAKWMAKYE